MLTRRELIRAGAGAGVVVALAGWRVPEARAVGPLLLGTHSHILWADGYPSVSTVMSWPESKVVRLDVGWWNFEAGSAADFPNSSWHAKLDAAISAATQRGKKIIVVDLHTPSWASSNPSASDYNLWAPADPAYYGDFMGRMALRYKGRVYGWELRNEPNHMGYFKAGDNSVGARAQAFGEMVIAAFPKIRAADPAAKVITGGISECDAPFIDAVYGSDGRFASSYDAVGLHPFSWNRAPDRSYRDSPETVDFPRGTAAVRAVIDRYKANTRLWFNRVRLADEPGSSRALAEWGQRVRSGGLHAAAARLRQSAHRTETRRGDRVQRQGPVVQADRQQVRPVRPAPLQRQDQARSLGAGIGRAITRAASPTRRRLNGPTGRPSSSHLAFGRCSA